MLETLRYLKEHLPDLVSLQKLLLYVTWDIFDPYALVEAADLFVAWPSLTTKEYEPFYCFHRRNL